MPEVPITKGGELPAHWEKTLLDEFAMAALTVSAHLVQNVNGCVEAAPLAKCSYAIAKAMMTEREGQK